MSHSYPRLVNNQPDHLYGRLFEDWAPQPLPIRDRPSVHLMVVAGARGAGKSTFLKALIAGEIGAKVLPNVPRRAGLWQEFDPTKYREWMPWVTASDGERKRVALHCDLLDCLLGLNAPALDLFGLARKVTLVAIKPDLARLTAQYANRESSGVLGLLGKGEAPESLWKAVNPKRDAASLTLVNPGEWIERMADGRRLVLAGYAKPGWIDGLYAEWEHVAERLTKGVPLRILEVAPTGRFDWALVRDSSRRNPPSHDLSVVTGT